MHLEISAQMYEGRLHSLSIKLPNTWHVPNVTKIPGNCNRRYQLHVFMMSLHDAMCISCCRSLGRCAVTQQLMRITSLGASGNSIMKMWNPYLISEFHFTSLRGPSSSIDTDRQAMRRSHLHSVIFSCARAKQSRTTSCSQMTHCQSSSRPPERKLKTLLCQSTAAAAIIIIIIIIIMSRNYKQPYWALHTYFGKY